MKQTIITLLACGVIGGSLWFNGCTTPNEGRENRGVTSSPTVSPTPYSTAPAGSPTISPGTSPSPVSTASPMTSPARRSSPSPTPTRRS
jgi:hypothetical protein